MPRQFFIDHHSGVPAYRQLMDQIKFQVAAGVLPPGTELASTRALSAELSLNPMTISKAYGLLEREGVLDRRRGQTLVVRPVSAAELEANRLEPLRQHLDAAVVMARQLGIPREQALRLFRETFDSRPS
jgi:GntR family transcriptional regulator